MVCIISSTGRKIISKVLLLDARIPNGIPINMQNNTAVKIIANVVILSDQRSTRSINIKLRKEKTANFNPFEMDFLEGLQTSKILENCGETM